MLSWFLFRTRFNGQKLVSLIPVVAGVGFATYGDYYFTRWGFLLTLTGTVLAAMKTIATNLLQSPPLNVPAPAHIPKWLRFRLPLPAPLPYLCFSIAVPCIPIPTLRFPRLNLHPLDLLTRMSPLAFAQCVFYARLSGELDELRHFATHLQSWEPLSYTGSLFVNGIIAFALNVVSFQANRRAGALSMGVAGMP